MMVGDLPDGWEYMPLLDIIDLHDNRRIPLNQSERAHRQGPYPYYGANGQVDSIDDFIFDGDYILLAEDGGHFDDPNRPVAYEVSGKFWVNNHAHVLSLIEGIPRRFITYLLNTVNWMPYVSGTTRLKLSQRGMKRVSIPLPPLAEQRRIVAKLDSIFARTRKTREELSRIPTLIEWYKQAILAAAFSGELTADWRANHDNSLQQWTTKPLVELIDEGPNNGYSPKTSDNGKGPLTLRLSATTKGTLDLSEYAVKRVIEPIPEDSRFWLYPGDILVQRANSINYLGATAIFDGPINTYIYPDLMMRIRIKDRWLREYMWRYLNSSSARQYLQSRATGTAGNMPKISGKILKLLPVPVPPQPELKAVVIKLRAIFPITKRLITHMNEIESLIDHLEQATLTKAFRGELVPQDPNDEPASMLLERINNVQDRTTQKKLL